MKKWLCMALAMMMTLTCFGAFAAPTVTTNLNTVVGIPSPSDYENYKSELSWEEFVNKFSNQGLAYTEDIAKITAPKGEDVKISLKRYNESNGQWEVVTNKYSHTVVEEDGKEIKETTDLVYNYGFESGGSDHPEYVTLWHSGNVEDFYGITYVDIAPDGVPSLVRLNVGDLTYEFYADWIIDEDGKLNYIKLWEKLAALSYDEDDTITYSHNSVCSFGPHYRDLEEAKTDKWYTFSVIDVSQDGKQTLPLIGGNVYIIGFVTIERKGDELTLKTRYLPDVWVYNEFYTLFPDYESITSTDLDNLTDGYAFGQTLSIADDLDGDTSLILQVRNEATFKSDNKAIRRFYENLDEFKAWRQAMLSAIGKTETTVPKRYDVAPKQ